MSHNPKNTSTIANRFTVIDSDHGACATFQLKLSRRQSEFVYLNRCSLDKAVHALLARRQHDQPKESVLTREPMALSLSRSTIRADNACCDRPTLTDDIVVLPILRPTEQLSRSAPLTAFALP